MCAGSHHLGVRYGWCRRGLSQSQAGVSTCLVLTILLEVGSGPKGLDKELGQNWVSPGYDGCLYLG